MGETFHFYWGGPFSQWQASTIDLDGQSFSCAEQAMMYGKAMLFGDQEAALAILKATDPGKQKALGREVRGFDEGVWDREKLALVLRINLAKFGQNKGLRRKLFQTGQAGMVEASPIDTIWGIGLDAKAAGATPPDEWPGQNLLGLALTRVKEILKAEHPDEWQSISKEGHDAET
jgi:ribA/ribD-fused uncharacterized protein